MKVFHCSFFFSMLFIFSSCSWILWLECLLLAPVEQQRPMIQAATAANRLVKWISWSICTCCVHDFFRIFVNKNKNIKPHHINFHTTHIEKKGKESHISCINTRPSQRTKHCDITEVTNVHIGALYSYLRSRYRYCCFGGRWFSNGRNRSERKRASEKDWQSIKKLMHIPTIFYHSQIVFLPSKI